MRLKKNRMNRFGRLLPNSWSRLRLFLETNRCQWTTFCLFCVQGCWPVITVRSQPQLMLSMWRNTIWFNHIRPPMSSPWAWLSHIFLRSGKIRVSCLTRNAVVSMRQRMSKGVWILSHRATVSEGISWPCRFSMPLVNNWCSVSHKFLMRRRTTCRFIWRSFLSLVFRCLRRDATVLKLRVTRLGTTRTSYRLSLPLTVVI